MKFVYLCVCVCMTLLFMDVCKPKPQNLNVCCGRLKFTVVSEPMDDDEECVDVGHAFLDLQELLLTGRDVTERQIDSRCLYFVCYFFVLYIPVWNNV